MVKRFWKPYIGQAGGELDLMVLIGGEEERVAISHLSHASYTTRPCYPP
jgi:hypothetical protein